jgi:hypothetical protein
MKRRRSGKRHPLLLYRRTMGRLWKSTLMLGIVLGGAGGWSFLNDRLLFGDQGWVWLMAGAATALFFSGFAFLSRYMTYVKAYHNHLQVVTPFLRLKISYRRIRSVHPSSVQQIFPPQESKWSQRKTLEPYYGKTAILIELAGFPMHPLLLRMFLPAEMFAPNVTGLVLLVPDWMAFSTELDSLQGAWLQSQGRRTAPAGGAWWR